MTVPTPTSRRRLLMLAATAALVLSAATGCVATAPEQPDSTRAATPGLKALGEGFLGSSPSPTPEATVNPAAGSWDGVEPPPGYRVVLITAGDDEPTATLVDAIEEWARERDALLTVLPAANDDEVEVRIGTAVELEPALVVGAGSGVVDVFALQTAQHLHQQFLVVGAELPEPTANTTSVVWEGATFRGTGLSTADETDPAAVTPARARAAIAAGTASVLHGLTGIVVRLPS